MKMKKTVYFLLFFSFSLFVSHAQIHVDKYGNVTDQRKSNNTTQSGSNTTSNTSGKTSVSKSKSSFDLSKLSIGGGFGLQFGDYTMVNISPQVGYDFSKYITLGAGFGYTYYNDDYGLYDYKNSYLSFNVFGRFYPINYLVLSVQPEISRMWQTVKYDRNDKYTQNEFVPSVLLGGGFTYNGLLMMLQYDLVQDKYSPYGDRLFYTVGYTFRF